METVESIEQRAAGFASDTVLTGNKDKIGSTYDSSALPLDNNLLWKKKSCLFVFSRKVDLWVKEKRFSTPEEVLKQSKSDIEM